MKSEAGNLKPETADPGSETRELGILYGVGVGPGDPGLVTMRAVEAIRAAATVAFPVHKEGAGSRALDAVAEYLPDETIRLPLLMPMTKDENRLHQAHETAAAQLAEAGKSGDVACLALGDPLFYSTFGYLAGDYPGSVKVISGVSAISATAAAIGLPLAAGDTPTVVITGVDSQSLAAALKIKASIVIIKPRALTPEAFDMLDEAGAWRRACAALELGGPQEKIITNLDRSAAERLPYFAIIWIRP